MKDNLKQIKIKKPKLINNFKNDGSSAIYFDLRNSTQLVRKFNTQSKLKFHSEFLLDIKLIVFQESNVGKVSINDTGDGFICLFWNETHAWSAFRLAVAMEKYINLNKEKYTDFLKKQKIDSEFGFGIGLHSASSIVYRYLDLNRDFMFGKVLNTTARLESFTKTFKNINLLMTDYFIYILKKQTFDYNKLKNTAIDFKEYQKKNIRLVTNDKVEINDYKKNGHSLYTICDNHEILDDINCSA